MALAGLAGTPRRAACLGLLGWMWLVAGEAVTGEGLFLGIAEAPASGWEASASIAASDILLPFLDPLALAGAATWAVAAGVLAAVLAARSVVVRAVGALAWGAGLVALSRLIAGTGTDPVTTGLLVALVAILVVGIWARSLSARPPGPRTLVARPTHH